MWIHPALSREELTLSGGDGNDAKPYKGVREILRKLREVQQ